MKKILVTGGAGFIGSAVVRHIIQNTQDSVVNVDKLTYAGNLESLTEVADNPRYAFEQVDICNRAELDRVFAQHQPDAVMHLAAESHVDRSIDSAGEFIQTNIVGTFNLLEAARAYWQQMPSEKREAFRFHHISTDEVYGDLHGTDDLFTETTPLRAVQPLLCLQSVQRPPRPRMVAYLRFADHCNQLLQQLRPLPFPENSFL